MDWAGSVGLIGPIRRFWADLGLAEKKGKRRGTVGWVRKDGKERRFVCFVFLHKHHLSKFILNSNKFEFWVLHR